MVLRNGQGEPRQHARAALRAGFYSAFPTELDSTLAYGGEAHPCATAFEYSYAVVGYLQLHCVGGFVYQNADAAGLGVGVTCDIGEGLLGNAVGGYLHSGGQQR